MAEQRRGGPRPDRDRPTRPRGEGAVFWREDRQRWVAVVNVAGEGEPADLRTLSAKTEAAVLKRRRELLQLAARGRVPSGRARLSLELYLRRWLETEAPHKVGPSTLAEYRSALLAHVIPALGHRRLSALTADDVRAYQRRKLAEGYSPVTIQNHRVALSSALQDAIPDLIRENVVRLVKRPRAPRRRPPAMPADVARQIRDAVAGTWLEGIVELAQRLGLRRAEILALRWEDVLWDRNLLRVWETLQRVDGALVNVQTKTARSSRLLHLPAGVVVALRRQEARQHERGHFRADGHVFTNHRTGRPLEPTGVSHWLRTFLLRAALAEAYAAAGAPYGAAGTGVDRWIREHPDRVRAVPTLHEQRHAFATMLFAAGAELKEVSEALGHASIKTTADVYLSLLPSSSERLARLSDEAFGPPLSASIPPDATGS